MSELAFYLQPRPAYEPIRTKGNQFWRDDERFVIKGINYVKRKQNAAAGYAAWRDSSVLDALADEQLDELRVDVRVLGELGINTVLVTSLDAAKDHHAAFRLLAENGFYVIVKVGLISRSMDNLFLSDDADLSEYYDTKALQNELRLMHQVADYENVLGFMVSGDPLNSRQRIRFAPLLRAFVRDAKAFLRLRGGRQVPVGISNPQVMEIRMQALQYFTAGAVDERVDFFAPQDYRWCSPSNFQISGWKHTVESLERNGVCVPMFLAEFGCNTNTRTWDEITCLYSADMLGLFNGGCLYCYEEYGNGYGIVVRHDEGKVEGKPEFDMLKSRLRAAQHELNAITSETQSKDYEGWRGEFPCEERYAVWVGSSTLPPCPIDLRSFTVVLQDERDWVLVEDIEGLHIME